MKMNDWDEYKFPKHYKPLPPGYRILWTGTHFMWVTEKEEGEIYWDRYRARRSAFSHYANK
jgi:hypothetical protein